MNLLNELLNEYANTTNGIDIGNGFRVVRVGRDINGNFSYWVSFNGKRAKKIDVVGNIKGDKVMNIRDFASEATNHIKQQIKDYYLEYLN